MHGSQRIAGRAVTDGDHTFHVVNAFTGEALPGTFVDATEAEVRQAARHAREAARTLRASPFEARARFLRDVADALDARRDALVERAHVETGLGVPRLQGEVKRTTDQLRLFADEGADGAWLDVRVDDTRGGDLRRTKMPVGPVAVFGASNFPFAFSVAGGDTASAWAAGCPVIFKAHPAHPGTCEGVADTIAEVLEQSDLPAATFQMVQGARNEVGGALVQAPEVRAVAFTGSYRGGTALDRLARERPDPIPVFAEMGSVNPVFVLPRAVAGRADALAEQLAASVSLGVGQFCTNPGLVIGMNGPELDAFVDALTRELAAVEAAPMLTDGIRGAFEEELQRMGGEPSVDVCHRGAGDGRAAGPALLRTTADAVRERPSLMDEVFGPSTLVIGCRDEADMARLAAVLPGSLTATLQMDEGDMDLARDLTPALIERIGRLIVNGVPTGVIVSPAQHHGGPYPATLDERYTSVGTAAVDRFLRPIAFQDVPPELLPRELR